MSRVWDAADGLVSQKVYECEVMFSIRTGERAGILQGVGVGRIVAKQRAAPVTDKTCSFRETVTHKVSRHTNNTVTRA